MLDRESSIWAIRFFLGREPSGEEEIAIHRQHPNLESLRYAFSITDEFQSYLRQGKLKQGMAEPYRAPLFLLDPPAAPNIPRRFEQPSLARPVSQLCTQQQMLEPAYKAWCSALGIAADMHRKHWEFAYVLAAMDAAGVLLSGCRALGFGVGSERIPSFLASRGLQVVATDAPMEAIAGHGWESTNQHSHELKQLHVPSLLSEKDFNERVSFRPVDMNSIPPDLRGFDVCWSSCCFEHLGSIRKGLDFFVNSMDALKPGGIAVHTTEFNLSSNGDTIEAPTLSLFRKRDIEGLVSRLVDAGHEVWPLNLHPGSGEVDEYIDLPPYALPHLKLQVQQYVSTSVGIVARKRH